MKTIHVFRAESGFMQAAPNLEKANEVAIRYLNLLHSDTFSNACIEHLRVADCEIDYHQRVADWIEDNYRIQIMEIPYYE